ncbi:MAG: hypothetical protein R2860_03110 [Desulfobacterales bacterium]
MFPVVFHVLGYGFDLDHPALNRALQAQQSSENGNPQIIARLNALGFDISLDTVVAKSKDARSRAAYHPSCKEKAHMTMLLIK